MKMSPRPCLLLLAALALAGCERSAERASGAADRADCCAVEESTGTAAAAMSMSAAAARTGGESIYGLDASWRDQTGRALRLGDLAGRPRVLAMIFTHCEYACPRILAELRALERELPASPEAGPGFVLVSFDVLRDEPAALAAYAEAQGLDPRRWTLLHGEAGAVRELSVVLDVAYRAEATGGFAHASVINVLDAEGRLVYQKRGLGGELTDCQAAIAATLAAPASASASGAAPALTRR
jgi:protein SCO1/2